MWKLCTYLARIIFSIFIIHWFLHRSLPNAVIACVLVAVGVFSCASPSKSRRTSFCRTAHRTRPHGTHVSPCYVFVGDTKRLHIGRKPW